MIFLKLSRKGGNSILKLINQAHNSLIVEKQSQMTVTIKGSKTSLFPDVVKRNKQKKQKNLTKIFGFPHIVIVL